MDERSSLVEIENSGSAATPEQSHKLSQRVSRLRAYCLLDPLIFFYTFLLGSASWGVSYFDPQGSRQHALARTWSRWILATTMCPVTVVGMENIAARRPAIYAANHISALDIPVLYANLPFQFRILAKQELFRYPFVGGHLKRSGQFPIDQSNARASIRSLSRAIESLKQGMPLVIFPEGGRAADGHISEFMGGAFYAAIKAQVPVIPMAIVGTFEALPMNSFHLQPRTLQLQIGNPIYPEGSGSRELESLAHRTQCVIEDMYYAHSQVPDPRPSRE
ncbi:MAG TPA: lysophospholipid acyltransferase family protein [Terriglobales bacterium]|nr:lysophospholipid acyltransferase family protein [Terriglobales bacterium]